MKKKLLSIFFIGLLTFLLVGCDLGGSTTVPATNPTTTATTATTTTRTTTLTTTTTTVATVAFNRQDLVDFIVDSKDETLDASEVDAEIEMYMEILGMNSEEDLYHMLMMAEGLMLGLMQVETHAQFQTWYLSAKTAGFNQTLLTTTMMNAVMMLVDQSMTELNEDAIMEDIADFEAQIIALEAEITAIRVSQGMVRNQVVTYSQQFLTPVLENVVSYYDRLVMDHQAQVVFDEYFYEISYSDEFDWETYYDLEY